MSAVDDLYSGSDYLSLNLPLNPQTKRMIGFRLINLLPKGACVVNTARVELIDEAGLLEALEKRPDVRYATDCQPSGATVAAIQAKYADRVYWTPQKLGAQTEEANLNAGLAAARQIVAYFERGDRTFVVNP